MRWSSSAALTGALRFASSRASDFVVNVRPSGSPPRRCREVRIELVRLDEQPRAEAADVAVDDVRPVV